MQPRRASFTQHAIALAVAAAFQPQLLAQTLPSGGQVAAGQATISQPAPGFMQIDQASHKAILNWESFSIGPGGHVNFFQQQGPSSVALNRVLGNNPSQIFGSLTANGRVFLVNPSGILFGPTASVSVGGLVASTLSITDQNFLDGNYVFSNAGGAGSVVNQGSINSFSGYTALLAPQVTNEGFIFANMGNVALAAGERVSLDMVGDNLIRVSVDQAALDAAIVNRGNVEAFGGNVLLTARSANALLDTVLNTEGVVRAFGMTMQDGEIVLDGGSRGAMAIGGQVEAGGRLSISGADVTVTGYASSWGGQNVAARSLSVIGRDGMVASLANMGGEQVIAIAGDGASPGLDVVSDGGLAAQIQQLDSGSAQTITVTAADHILVDGRSAGPGPFTATAGIFSAGTQSISITGSGRNAITVGGEGSTGAAQVRAATQSMTAGAGDESGSVSVIGASAPGAFVGIVAGQGGMETQTISTTGLIRIAGAPAPAQNMPTGIFHNGRGQQTIRAAGMDVIAAASGSGNGAFVNSNGGGDQWIEIAGGELRVIAGQGGANNTAGIGNTSNGNQTILGNPDILVSGGATSNAAIQPGFGKLQTIEARNITLTNGVDSPGNSAGVLLGSHQRITATGDVTLTARSGTGTASGVRIGGPTAGGPTDLVLNVGGNLVLTGGTSGTNGAGLGGAGSGTAFDNNIVVVAGGDVILDGAAGGGGARIGSSGLTAVPGGDISVTGRSIQFIGSAPTAIRTLGDVTLNASEILQGPNGLIAADGLSTGSSGATSLVGPNQVSRVSGSSGFGDLTLNNIGPLEVSSLLAPNATLTNAGPVHISGPWTTFGNTTIVTTGTGSSLLVTDSVFANGDMNVDVSGDLTVRGSGVLPMNVASSGNQTINVTGGSLALEGAFTQVASHGGDQTVTVLDGDHIRIISENGAFTGMSAAGTQTISITGSGRNAMEFGSAGGSGSIFVSAPTLRLTAGVGRESGSITITGPDAPNTSVQVGAGFPFPVPGEQTISTTGALTVVAGSRPDGMPLVTGIVHNGFGPQIISAGSLELRGGAAGFGNPAAIISIGGGEQRIDVAGDLVVIGGPGGLASLFSSASQAISAANMRLQGAFAGANGGAFVNAFGQDIDVSGDITVAGGSGTNNGAGIHSTGALQSISASNLRLQGGFGGANSGAFVNGLGQDIAVSGDITLAGGSGTNNAAGIHSLPALQPIGVGQNLQVGGEIVVAGGSGVNNGASINSSGAQTILGRPDITVTAGVSNFATINAGPGALQTIEADDIRLSNSTGPGNSAGVIQGTHQHIDATGDVTLTAHAAGGELVGARIGGATGSSTDLHLRLDGNLVLTGGSVGQNGVSLGGSVTGAALANDIVVRAGGDVILDGSSGGAGVRIGVSPRVGIAGGNIAIEAANIRIVGEAPAAIRTLGNVDLRAGEISQSANGLILASALTTQSQGATLLAGQNQVSSFSGSATGDLFLRNLSPLLALGPVSASGLLSLDQSGSLLIQAGESPLVVRGGAVNVVTGGDLRLVGGTGYRALAELVSGGDIDATIGGAVRLDTGAGDEAWARIRSEGADGVMRFTFPNLTSGGFYVDGVDGDVKHGLTGFFILNKPVKIGETLLLEYQQ